MTDSLTGKLTIRGIVFDYEEFEKFVGMRSTEELQRELTITKTKQISNRFMTRTETCYRIIKSKDRKLILFSRFSLEAIKAKIKCSRLARNLSVGWKFQNTIAPGEFIKAETLLPGPTLDLNQTIAMDHLINTVYATESELIGRSSTVLVMGTGMGKSYMAAAAVGRIGRKTLIIAPSDIVLSETRSALSNSYPTLIIGEYNCNTKIDGDVVLMIINSALNDEFVFTTKQRIPGQRKLELQTVRYKWYEYFSKFGFVIYDEIHNYTSTNRQEIFWRTNFRFGLGLTATPNENSWEMDMVFQRHVGDLIREADIPNYNQNQIVWQGSVIPIYYEGPSEHTRRILNDVTGWTSHGDMCNQFTRDPYRNKLIMTLLVQLWKENRNVFVFSRTREHVDRMAGEFSTLVEGGTKTDDTNHISIALMGGASSETVHAARSASMIFITYDYGWQGVSIPKMDTLVFTTPRVAKMRQIRGRITRKSGDITIHRRIYDIVDANTELGKNEFRERKKIFNEESNFKFNILPKVSVSWDNIPDEITANLSDAFI